MPTIINKQTEAATPSSRSTKTTMNARSKISMSSSKSKSARPPNKKSSSNRSVKANTTTVVVSNIIRPLKKPRVAEAKEIVDVDAEEETKNQNPGKSDKKKRKSNNDDDDDTSVAKAPPQKGKDSSISRATKVHGIRTTKIMH